MIITPPSAFVRDLTLPRVEIPRALMSDLAANQHLERKFFESVSEAITRSLDDSDTRIRILTESALKERVEACYTVLVNMRREMKMSLTHCFDILPRIFIDALKRDARPDDLADKESQDKMWPKGERKKEEVYVKDVDVSALEKDVDKETGE